jgi:hypothetical protein
VNSDRASIEGLAAGFNWALRLGLHICAGMALEERSSLWVGGRADLKGTLDVERAPTFVIKFWYLDNSGIVRSH